MTTLTDLPDDAIQRLLTDDRWLGFGYLGERRSALDDSDPECPARPQAVADADAWILARANRDGWTYDELFEWANSKYGRWFGEQALSAPHYTDQLARMNASPYFHRLTEGDYR